MLIQEVFSLKKYECLYSEEENMNFSIYYELVPKSQISFDLFHNEEKIHKALEHFHHAIVKEFSSVMYGYKFKDYEYVMLNDEINMEMIKISRDVIDKYRKGDISIADVKLYK